MLTIWLGIVKTFAPLNNLLQNPILPGSRVATPYSITAWSFGVTNNSFLIITSPFCLNNLAL